MCQCDRTSAALQVNARCLCFPTPGSCCCRKSLTLTRAASYRMDQVFYNNIRLPTCLPLRLSRSLPLSPHIDPSFLLISLCCKKTTVIPISHVFFETIYMHFHESIILGMSFYFLKVNKTIQCNCIIHFQYLRFMDDNKKYIIRLGTTHTRQVRAELMCINTQKVPG